MANQQTPAAPQSSGADLERWIAGRQHLLSLLLLGLSALFAALVVVQLILSRRDEGGNLPVGAWAGAMTLLCLGGGLYLTFEQQTGAQPGQEGRYRLLVLLLGGLAGLVTFLLGVWLPLGPWAAFIVPGETETGVAAVPLLKVWRENWWRIAVCGLSVVGGLAIMLVSLQLARSVERVSAGMRRLLYGYNAGLTGLLLLAILGLLNVLSYVYLWPFTLFAAQVDWTPSQIYTLSPRSIEILQKEVDGDVELIVMMPFNYPITDEFLRLVQNVRQYNKRITTTLYSPDATPQDFIRTLQRYANLIDPNKTGLADIRDGRVGVIVVYRREGKEDAQFMNWRDLFEVESGQRGETEDKDKKPRIIFKGENQLMRALVKLVDKEPAKIIFTTGHGELSLSGPSFGRGERLGASASELKRMLDARGNYDFKEVKLGIEGIEGGKALDADVVVVARPTEPFPPKAVEALRNYIKPVGTSRKGKLIILLDTQVRGGKMLQTNLEPLLREFDVEVSDKRLLSQTNRPDIVVVVPNRQSENPVARAFGGLLLYFQNARKAEATKAGAGGHKVDDLLLTVSDIPVWEEPNLTESARDLFARYRRSGFPEGRKPTDTVPVAVAVSETAPQQGLPPGHVPVQSGVPRLVVFGDGSWLTNESITREGSSSADLFASCISWLRGKADLGPSLAEDKERKQFSLRNRVTSSEASRLAWLPLGLIFISIVGLGGGIWVARRR
ncbi:MAG: Gldg family protein [Planctomycetes bacterium]|nr:Gldg family protein [Planctomycetota bacterium]